jgi:hypothetical protein
MGIVYLVQPAELVGTNRFKIGCSSKSNLNRVHKGYKQGTRYLFVCDCEDPFDVEQIMKVVFKEKFILIAGSEYFEGYENEICTCFVNVIQSEVIARKLCKHCEQCKQCETCVNELKEYHDRYETYIKEHLVITNDDTDRAKISDVYTSFKYWWKAIYNKPAPKQSEFMEYIRFNLKGCKINKVGIIYIKLVHEENDD